ncbi:AbrB/MazE/SpoVT family DNA-binding domain-containing protein [Halorarius litoreus]|uniref:AbrB/MazE/SpoVT family DNA-binding domain-containing protein n=1 Tax=Halorarius litoreus TaxID=2962676 RepID=UPI0020CDB630|nr:AbrB/MazE/SpoVT family DNA-binding domain-containing protein [Halorarius litoreus]
METRKLQMVGGGTYTVSIPKEWATDHALEAGTPVHLYTHRDGSIVVRSARKEGDRLDAARLDIDGDSPDLVRRSLRVAHAMGFETVTLVHESAFTDAQRRVAREGSRSMVGADTDVAADDELVVRNLVDASEVSVPQSVDQLGFIARSIQQAATAAVLDADAAARDRLTDRATEARRLFDMVSRHLNRALVSLEEVDRLGTSRPALFDHYVAAHQLEHVAEQGVRLAGVAERLSDPVPDPMRAEVQAAADEARGVVDDATAALLHDPDADAAHAALDRRDATLAALDTLDETLFDAAPTDVAALVRVVDALRHTTDAGGEIAQTAVRAAIRAERL